MESKDGHAGLVDGFGRVHRYLRVSVTDRCNLRCRYCMPAEGVELKGRDEILRFEEIVRLVRVFAGCGVDKVRITGGEPLVRKGVDELVGMIAEVSGIKTVAMTTNGILLAKQVERLKRAGLTQLNVSLDTLRAERFGQITLRDKFEDVVEGIAAALAAGFEPLKVNVVVMEGFNEDELLDFVEYVRDRPINVRFIEYMPFAGNGWERMKMVPYARMREVIESRYKLVAAGGVDGSAVAKDFGIEGILGTVSFITSMTENFCSSCDRIRLTAEGSIRNCLFGQDEWSLRDAMRNGASDEVLEEIIRRAIWQKKAGHGGMDALARQVNLAMVQIGG